MLGRLEQKQGLWPFPVDPRMHPRADADSLRPNDTPHEAHALGKVDEHDIVRIGWRTRVHDRHGVNGSKPACDHPFPLAVARSRLGDAGRKEASPAAAGALQPQLTLRQRFSPLVLRTHQAKL